MSDPIFGISITRVDNEPRPAVVTDMSVVGLVFTAPDADESEFPLDTPVQFFSDDAEKLAKMGKDGTGYRAVSLINEQLGEFQAAANIVGVRVAEGVSIPETIANLRGDINARTGMFALLNAGAELGITPRIICIPGYTSQALGFVKSVTITNAGSGYEVGDAISGTGGGGSGFTAEVSEVDSDGKITGVTITDPGSGYTSTPALSVSSSGGTGATLTAVVDTVSNAIVASLPTLLDRLLAVAVVDGPATTLTDAINWRESIQSMRIIPVDPAVKVMDEDGSIITVPASPAIVGVGVRRDHEFSGRPFHSWANQPIRGIVGPSRPIEFSILDGASEGQQLLAKNIGVIVRGENTDGAVADGGYVFVGTDTCSENPLWTFYNQVRGRDYIHLMFVKTLRYFLGRRNIDRGTIEDILNTMTFALRDIQAQGDLLGFRVGFNRDTNSPEQLRLGRFTVAFAAEEPPVLRYLGIQSARYRPALDTLLNDLLTQLDVNA
jgi:Phage tail sheath protein FI